MGGIVDDAISDAGSDDGLETLPALLGAFGEADAQDQHAPSGELEYGLPPSIARALAHQVQAQHATLSTMQYLKPHVILRVLLPICVLLHVATMQMPFHTLH